MKIKIKKKTNKNSNLSNEQIINFILKNRKIEDIETFINPPNPSEIFLSDFCNQKKINKAIKVLGKIKEKNGMIIVYTDYDADGITGGTVLWETLYLLGFKVMPHVPDRKKEGYGFSKLGINNVKKEYNPSLIISVDHGITGKDNVRYANKLGIKVIITDHHLKVKEKIPLGAEAIFHIPIFSGSGVAYFFAKELFRYFGKKSKNYQKLKKNFENDYLSIASIGTIADLVPLVGPSRSLVKYGLENFSKIKRVGIKHILEEAKIKNKRITPYEIGFIIAPRINAVGRLESAVDALRLLCTTKEERAKKLATYLGKKNKERQNLVHKAIEEGEKILAKKTDNLKNIPKIIVIEKDDWNEGIIGLVASKMMDKYYRPAIIMTKSNGFYKGSARSTSSFHITNFLRLFKDELISIGGHKQASGFSLKKENLSEFIKKVKTRAKKEKGLEKVEKKIEVDMKLPLLALNLKLAKKMQKLEPFGIGNPRPLFLSEGKIVNAQLFGKNKNHLKIWLDDGTTRNPFQFIFFFKGKKFININKDSKVKIIYHLDINYWQGKEILMGMGKEIVN